MSVKWVPDQIQEKIMAAYGLEYRGNVLIPARQIDLEKSKSKNVRPSEDYDVEHANRLAVLMRDNKPFKSIALWQPQRSEKYLIVHGVHRGGAAIELLGESEVMAYVITGPTRNLAKLIDAYARIANSYDISKTPSVEDSYLNAKWLIEKLGKSRKDAAAMVGLPDETVSKYMRQDEIYDALREDNVDVRKLNRSHITPLSPIKNTKVRKRIATMIIKYRIPGSSVYDYTKRVQAKGTEGEQLAEIERCEKLLKRTHKPAASAMLDVRVLSDYRKAVARVANLLNTRLQVRTLLNVLEGEDMRFATELGEKLIALGDKQHAASKREDKIIGETSSADAVATVAVG